MTMDKQFFCTEKNFHISQNFGGNVLTYFTSKNQYIDNNQLFCCDYQGWQYHHRYFILVSPVPETQSKLFKRCMSRVTDFLVHVVRVLPTVHHPSRIIT